MPLIMLCGGPLSGKTLLTKKLEQKCKELYPDRECQVLSHEVLNISRLVFKDMNTEKKFNQKLISLVEQALTSRRVLIVDFICLTKSLRYQLYGKANFTGTVSCVVNCTTPYETTLERHQSNLVKLENNTDQTVAKQYYTTEIFEDLWNRLEPPLDTCRWDYPCFDIDCSDVTPFLPTTTVTDDQQQQVDPHADLYTKILQSICEQSTKKLSRANLPTRNESSGFVSILDKITTSIVEQIIHQQQEKGFVVGALLETQTCQVEVDISQFIGQSLPSTTPTGNNDNDIEALNEQTSELSLDTTAPTQSGPTESTPTSPTTPTVPSSGLKMVRKTVRGKKPMGDATTPSNTTPQQSAAESTKYTLTIKNPITPSALFELKQSFTRVATMMNVKSSPQMAKAFVEYLAPQLNPA